MRLAKLMSTAEEKQKTDAQPQFKQGEEPPEFVNSSELPEALLARVYIKPGLDELERYHGKFGDVGCKFIKSACQI